MLDSYNILQFHVRQVPKGSFSEGIIFLYDLTQNNYVLKIRKMPRYTQGY